MSGILVYSTPAPTLSVATYVLLAVGCACLWLGLFGALQHICQRCNSTYQSKSQKDKVIYITYLNSLVHAPVACINSILCTYYVCGDGKTFFNDSTCANTPYYGTLFALNLSAAYLLVDFSIQLRYIGFDTTLEKLNLLHHVLGFFFMYLTEWPNNFTLVFGVVLLFMEVSALFTSGRWLMFEHGVSGGSWQQSVNSFFLFLSFLFCRVAFQTYVFVRVGIPYVVTVFYNLDGSGFSAGYKVMLFFMSVSVLVNYALNWYWMYLIVMQVYRILKRGLAGDSEFVTASAADKQDQLTEPLLEEFRSQKHQNLDESQLQI